MKKIINNSEIDYHPPVPLASKIVSNKTQFTPKNGTILLEDKMKDFSERRRHIAEMCEEYKADIGESQHWVSGRKYMGVDHAFN